MKRYIDLKDQIIEGNEEKHFAFFCTVSCKFEEFSGSQEWVSVKDFIEDYFGTDIDRYLSLIPIKNDDEITESLMNIKYGN